MKGVWRQRNTGCILALIMSRMMVMMIWSHHYQHQNGRSLRPKNGGEHPESSYDSSSCAGLPRPPACAGLPRPPACTGLPAGWKRGEVLAALLSLLEQRRVRRPLGRRPRSALVSQRRTGASTGRHPPKAAKQGRSGHQNSRRMSRATRRQRPPTGAASPRRKGTGSGGGDLASKTT